MHRLLVLCVIPLAVGCTPKKSDEERVPAPEAQRHDSVDVPENNGVPEKAVKCDPAASPTTCVGDAVHECQANGVAGTKLVQCDGACRSGACAQTCALRDAELIYVIDSSNTLLRFDPRKLPNDPFETVATLACSSRGPFSMGVDRNGIAWIEYDNGSLYRVSIVDGHCSHDAIDPDGAPREFGMGFVSDGPNAPEHLMTAKFNDGKSPTEIAELDLTVNPPKWKTVGSLHSGAMSPELSGTGDGQLFGYTPETPLGGSDTPSGRGWVQAISRTDGSAQGPRWQLPGTSKETDGWAFAHYAGVFYVFATFDDNSMVYAVHRKTGKVEQIMENLPHRIVGAGVSTCAPLLEAAP
ncbi:MAG TPA: hypothetical protein VGM39_15860 [Kofleriaceae bacterium]|jgi:hypothetical protein